MNNWPEHYPKQCPPESAYVYDGILYRFINRNNPIAKDFKSYYELEPTKDWGAQACQARGLSVLKGLTGVYEMRDAIPALRRKKVSSAKVSHIHGLLADTPSTSSKRHCTWWISSALSNPEDLFQTTSISENVHV